MEIKSTHLKHRHILTYNIPLKTFGFLYPDIESLFKATKIKTIHTYMLKNSQYKSVLISSKHVRVQSNLHFCMQQQNKMFWPTCNFFFAIDSQIKFVINKNYKITDTSNKKIVSK